VPDSAALRSDEVIVGCVTEDNPKFLGQTLRLLQSIRWFGGSLAQARVIVGAVERIDRRARRTLESLGAAVRIVPRFEYPNGSANRLQLFGELWGEEATHFLMLDCDTIVVRDPLPLLRRNVFHAKIAPFPTVTHACFERLFAHFGLPLPERTHVTPYSRTPTIPYFNAGVFSLSREVAGRLVPEWLRFNRILAAEPALAAPCARHLHQAALSLAIVSSGVPAVAAGSELNYQLNYTRRPPRSYLAIDPAIIHYHDLVDDDGLLVRTPFPRAQERIEEFHRRLRDERARAMAVRRGGQASRQVVILGAPRSGGSLAAEKFAAEGAHAGEADALMPPDVYHPGGSLRRRDVHALHDAILADCNASWLEPGCVDVGKARPERRDRAREIARSCTLFYDESMALLFPFWRDLLDDPFCALVWREPLATACSLQHAAGLPPLIGLAVWEEYTRRMLTATTGLPRVLLAFEDLAGEEAPVVDETLGLDLDDGQRALREALRSGAALRWSAVPPTPAETRALLDAFGQESAARRASELQRASRAWRAGSRVAALWRRLT